MDKPSSILCKIYEPVKRRPAMHAVGHVVVRRDRPLTATAEKGARTEPRQDSCFRK